MRERVVLGEGSVTPLVAREAISSIFLKPGLMNVWIGLSKVKRQSHLVRYGKADKITHLIGVDKPLNCGVLKRLVAVWDANLCISKMAGECHLLETALRCSLLAPP
jgi:hypothetical protein